MITIKDNFDISICTWLPSIIKKKNFEFRIFLSVAFQVTHIIFNQRCDK